MSFEITGEVSFEGAGEKGGLSPENLRSAYKLPSSGGSGQTVAIVDAFNDPNAASDLKKYRENYKLSECTEANKCFQKVNQKGETSNYPVNESGWSTEMSLDLDMVSAVCPECHILLVEATSNSFSSMDTAEDEAATLKATEISNSWGAPERSGETSEDKNFEHSGIPITVSAGDYCYINECKSLKEPNWPATSPDVIAVGGTKLEKASNSRGWNESVWYEPKSKYGEIGTGSGCSLYESKPSWETGSNCSKRTDGDVAAVAACESPLSIYDSYEREGWFVECGTSAASPIVSGVEALSTSEARKDGAELFGKLEGKGKLFDVTEGHNYSVLNGSCGSYLCEAKIGYDGPTGNGTPDGAFVIAGVPLASTERVTAVTKTGATLNGTVNPEGAETKYYFEYGTSESYGTKTAESSAGSGTSNVAESNAITGLTAGTKYYFRIVATNSEATTKGGPRTFTAGATENTELPVISPATPDQAVPESTTTGTWTIIPTSYAYQWERCNASGRECASISGATSSTYTPVEADVEHTLVVKVTAKNSEGEGSALSIATRKVQPLGTITEYSLPPGSKSLGITSGPDGNVWFTDVGTSKIGKITTSGTITEYSLPSESRPSCITTGPDKNLWFTSGLSDKIGMSTTSGSITEYSLPSGSAPGCIAKGPDENLWFTDEITSKIGKITTSGAITEYSLPSGSEPIGIVAGPDGDLWFAEYGSSKIGKITTSGTITEYSAASGSDPYGITAGPDGNLWFTAPGNHTIGKITTSGTITEYSLPSGSKPWGITPGPDKNLWFPEYGSSKIGKITTSGTITEYSLPTGSEPVGITTGPNNNLWFTEWGTSKIGQITP
jgi:streptogramin lyase